ncbi:hypothetical protein CDAR_196301 [Caerostris darwini]|uniref:Uncharacterized protein n=1 Tax=Caerostris darwini TaxID=1538125 RepID=A0AAV4PYY7_9ARAC|nr:hypothetical protein CDAR_196301 [Caerostris darwini]
MALKPNKYKKNDFINDKISSKGTTMSVPIKLAALGFVHPRVVCYHTSRVRRAHMRGVHHRRRYGGVARGMQVMQIGGVVEFSGV